MPPSINLQFLIFLKKFLVNLDEPFLIITAANAPMTAAISANIIDIELVATFLPSKTHECHA